MAFLSLHMHSFAGLYKVPHHVHPVNTCDRIGLFAQSCGMYPIFDREAMHEGWNMPVSETQ